MLQKERWLFDPKRGLPRDTKDPQQSDQPLRDFTTPPNTVVVDDQDFTSSAKKPKRSRPKRQPQLVIADEINDNVLVEDDVVVHEKKQRTSTRNKSNIELSSNVVFDVAHIEQTIKNQKPPKPPNQPKVPPQVTPDDINLMLDLKLEQMLGIISKNQTSIVRNFEKALEAQKKEIMDATAATRAASTKVGSQNYSPNAGLNYSSSDALNFSPCGGLNFSPSTSHADIYSCLYVFILYYNVKINFIYSEYSGNNIGTTAKIPGVCFNFCMFMCM